MLSWKEIKDLAVSIAGPTKWFVAFVVWLGIIGLCFNILLSAILRFKFGVYASIYQNVVAGVLLITPTIATWLWIFLALLALTVLIAAALLIAWLVERAIRERRKTSRSGETLPVESRVSTFVRRSVEVMKQLASAPPTGANGGEPSSASPPTKRGGFWKTVLGTIARHRALIVFVSVVVVSLGVVIGEIGQFTGELNRYVALSIVPKPAPSLDQTQGAASKAWWSFFNPVIEAGNAVRGLIANATMHPKLVQIYTKDQPDLEHPMLLLTESDDEAVLYDFLLDYNLKDGILDPLRIVKQSEIKGMTTLDLEPSGENPDAAWLEGWWPFVILARTYCDKMPDTLGPGNLDEEKYRALLEKFYLTEHKAHCGGTTAVKPENVSAATVEALQSLRASIVLLIQEIGTHGEGDTVQGLGDRIANLTTQITSLEQTITTHIGSPSGQNVADLQAVVVSLKEQVTAALAKLDTIGTSIDVTGVLNAQFNELTVKLGSLFDKLAEIGVTIEQVSKGPIIETYADRWGKCQLLASWQGNDEGDDGIEFRKDSFDLSGPGRNGLISSKTHTPTGSEWEVLQRIVHEWITQVATAQPDHPGKQPVLFLIGEASEDGDNAHNLRLTEKRAIAVKDLIVGAGRNRLVDDKDLRDAGLIIGKAPPWIIAIGEGESVLAPEELINRTRTRRVDARICFVALDQKTRPVAGPG